MTDGHSAMKQWNPDHRWRHLPGWTRKAFRKQLKERGLLDPDRSLESMIETLYPRSFIDHYGSIPVPGSKLRSFFTQPYGSDTHKHAEDFATRHGLRLDVVKPGIWHANATTFIFTPTP